MKPPKRNTRSIVRDPPVFAMIMVLHTPEMSLKIPAAICWIRNMSRNCLKNLKMVKRLQSYFSFPQMERIASPVKPNFSSSLPASFWGKSDSVICYNHPNSRFQYRNWYSKQKSWKRESPGWVKEKVSLLVKYRKSLYGERKFSKTIEHIDEHTK